MFSVYGQKSLANILIEAAANNWHLGINTPGLVRRYHNVARWTCRFHWKGAYIGMRTAKSLVELIEKIEDFLEKNKQIE